jgi:hypothetical protein
MRQVNIRLTSETNQQLRWLAAKHWTATDALRQGLLLGSTVSTPELTPAPYIHRRTLWLTDRELMILRSSEVSQSEAIRQAIAVAFSFYQRVHSLKEVVAA